MFAIYKNNKRSVRTLFNSYEKARQYVRQLIRKNHFRDTDAFWTSNPMIGDYDYSIRRV